MASTSNFSRPARKKMPRPPQRKPIEKKKSCSAEEEDAYVPPTRKPNRTSGNDNARGVRQNDAWNGP